MSKICIFAGTSEGRILAEKLAAMNCSCTICVATEYGELVLGSLPGCEIKAGKMPVDQITAMLSGGEYAMVVDATHPYASHITESIQTAAKETGVEYLRVLRSGNSSAEDGIFVDDIEQCIEFLKGTEGNILLTTGSKNLPVFCEDENLRNRIFARVLPVADSIRICGECGLPAARIIAAQGPFSREMNSATLKACNAEYMVTKDTGNAGGYPEKIAAAADAGAKVVIIGRPVQVPGVSVDEAAAYIAEKLGLEPCECAAPCESNACKPAKKHVFLVGIGMGNEDSKTFGMERAVKESGCIIGATRMLESAESLENKIVYKAIAAKDIADHIRTENCEKFAVLLSGDTGFYSGAKSLQKELEKDADIEVEVMPGIGSLSYISAKLGISWDAIKPVSLHGRGCNLESAVRENRYTFSLLGGKGGANEALKRLVNAGFGDITVHVGQRLGYPEESIVSGKAAELLEKPFDVLSVLVAENPKFGEYSAAPGLDDSLFERSEVPMTKSEVRAVTLSKMRIAKNSVVYDIGSGSGSCTVEFAFAASEGMVYAIEKNPQAVELTKKNVQRFGLSNVVVIEGSAPEALKDLPAPTHAFIGGSSGNMKEITELLKERNPKVRIGVNTVTLESQQEALELAETFEWSDICQLSVSKPRKLGRYNLMTAQNPVFIFTMQNK